MHLKDELVFLHRPVPTDDRWVDHVVPPFAALSAQPSRQKSSNYDPVLCSEFFNLGFENGVLFCCPLRTRQLRLNWKAFGLIRVVLSVGKNGMANFFEVQPPLEAADLGFVGHEFAKAMPALVAVNINEPF